MALALTSLEIAALARDIALVSFFVIGSLLLLAILIIGIVIYKRVSRLMDRIDSATDRVESMVKTVDSTAASVMKTASSVNSGIRAGANVRSAFGSMFGRGDREADASDKPDKKSCCECSKREK